MKHRCAVLFLIPTLLLAGVFIYSSQRSSAIYLNQWLACFGDGSLFSFLQNIELPLSGWIINSLPDALWMFALVLTVLLIWDFRIHWRSIPWIGCAIVGGLLFEVFQRFGVVPGTFDLVDLTLMLLAAFLPLSFILLKQNRCATK